MVESAPGTVDLEAVFNRVAEPIFVLNPDRRLVYCNRACEQLVGRPASELIGLICRYHEPQAAGRLAAIAGSFGPSPEILAGRPGAMATLLEPPDAPPLPRTVHFVPCLDDAGAVLCVVGFMKSPTESAPDGESTSDWHADLLRLRYRLWRRFGFDRLVAAGPAMLRVLDQAKTAAQTNCSVLLLGERGTGKETLARTIHRESSRRAAPFVAVSCATMSAEVLERELFGAPPDEPRVAGIIEQTVGGSVYLNELASVPRDVQTRLWDGMQRNQLASGRTSDVRFFVGDVTDPRAAVRDGRLRSDFYFATSTLTIELPPLRERLEDVPHLVQSFLEALNAQAASQVSGLSASAWDVIRQYDWPGNLAELYAVLAHAHAAQTAPILSAEQFPWRIRNAAAAGPNPARSASQPIDLDAFLLNAERKLIELAMRRARGNKSKAADLLSINRPRLYRRLEQFGMLDADPDSLDSPGDGSAEVDGAPQDKS